ncbi:MAG: cation-transporting P-type ATPase [Nitrospirae bacterium]|nr:cation-transporting P-type ATPase [Nitrospirota bacterium]
MKINELTREEVFRTLVTSETGLSEDEAGRRLAEFGPNAITAARKRPLWLRFLGQFTHFLAVLLWTAAGLSFLSEYLHPGEGMYTLGFAIFGVIVINAVFTFIQEYRAEKALEALKKLLPFHVTVCRGGRERELPAEEVVPGDIVRIAEGDKVPADLRLLEANDLRANNASLTGESEPLLRETKPSSGDPINSPNIAFAGTTIVNGSGSGVVYATGMRTEFGRIAQLTGTVTPGLSPLQKEIVKATRLVAAIAAAVGLFFFAIGFFIGRSFWDNFIFGVGITVALIPEGMLPTVTLALAMGSQRMAKRNALIKTLTSVETLGSVSVICTDKTGTLTQNRMEVKEAAGLGKMSGSTRERLFTVALHCNNTKEVNGELKGEPTEMALYRAAREVPGTKPGKRVREFPFDPDRKRMSTVTEMNSSTFVLAKGAPESVLAVCTHAREDGGSVPFDEALKQEATRLFHALMDKGLRVLAFAEREVRTGEDVANKETAEQAMVFVGFIGLEDPPRPEVPGALRKCREAGVRIIMITGDASRTAVAIAREIGLVTREPVVVEGAEFTRLSDQDLRNVLAKPEVLFTRMTPKYKLRVVNTLKDQGERVAVTGDGVNDAPALKRADIGIAMGITGTDVAKESADMVLLDDNFATIVNAIEEGRGVYENIKKFITYIFASNIPEAVPYLAYILFRIPLPLTIMQILAVDLGTDMLPALALGSEKPTPGVMKLPPRKPDERLIGLALISRAYLFLGMIEAVACMFGFFWMLRTGGWAWGTDLPGTDPLYLQATTACLTAIIVTQMANVFACRSLRESIFTIGWTTNRLIFLGLAVELGLQLFIVYHPWGHAVFSTAPLPFSAWLVLIPFAAALLLAEETRKFAVRRMAGR